MRTLHRAGIAAATASLPVALAFRFAVLYRERAGLPARTALLQTPDAYGLVWEPVSIESPAGALPGWFMPAPGRTPGPAVVLVHGWSSNRARMLPYAAFLHAAGFHCLVFDVRGHGENKEERLPVGSAEFGADAVAAVGALLRRDEVTAVGILGHSMGGAGACLAPPRDPSVGAVVSTSAPADPRLLVRETFRMASLPIPTPVAVPLAWLTAHVYVRPRGHRLRSTSARRALATFAGPVLIAHGDADEVIPSRNLGILERAARAGRSDGGAPVETLIVPGGHHRWLYEDAGYRRAVASFFARSLGGRLGPEDAGVRAASSAVMRPPDTDGPIARARKTARARR